MRRAIALLQALPAWWCWQRQDRAPASLARPRARRSFLYGIGINLGGGT